MVKKDHILSEEGVGIKNTDVPLGNGKSLKYLEEEKELNKKEVLAENCYYSEKMARSERSGRPEHPERDV